MVDGHESAAGRPANPTTHSPTCPPYRTAGHGAQAAVAAQGDGRGAGGGGSGVCRLLKECRSRLAVQHQPLCISPDCVSASIAASVIEPRMHAQLPTHTVMQGMQAVLKFINGKGKCRQ